MRGMGILASVIAFAILAGCGQEVEPAAEEAKARIILVTGATGTQGGAVASELLERGYAVRALTRNPDKPAARALAAAGAEVVRGDFEDPKSLLAAMRGAYGVFAVTDYWEHGGAKEAEHGRALVYAAEDSGIAHFVFSSVAGADADTGLAHFETKLAIEQMLNESALAYTVLRPVEFMDNWRNRLDTLRAGIFPDPRDSADMHQWIAASDIGFFVGEAFDHPDDWMGRTEEIAGDEMSIGELLAVMTDVFGRPVQQERVSWADFEAQAGPEVTAMYRWFAAEGYTVNLEALRSRYPNLVSVRDYLLALKNE